MQMGGAQGQGAADSGGWFFWLFRSVPAGSAAIDFFKNLVSCAGHRMGSRLRVDSAERCDLEPEAALAEIWHDQAGAVGQAMVSCTCCADAAVGSDFLSVYSLLYGI